MLKFTVTLKRDGQIVSQKKGNSATKTFPIDEHKKLTTEPYAPNFVKFDVQKYGTAKIVRDDTISSVQYYNKKTVELVGEVVYENGNVKSAWIEEQLGKYIIKREESFLQSGKPEKKRLLIYTRGYNFNNLVHFSFEKYKNGDLDFFATSIDDPAISNGEGDYVRYLYFNRNVKTKEVFKGNDFRYKFLSDYESAKKVPKPALYCVQGSVASRYTIDYSDILKQTDFKRTNKPCMIIDSRLGTEKFVDFHSAQVNHLPLQEQSKIFHESLCKIHLQYDKFLAQIKASQENTNSDITYDVDASQLENFLRNLELKEDVVQSIRIHGTLTLNNDYDCENIFSQNLNNPYAIVEIDMSNCNVKNANLLHFHNCPSLYCLLLPKGFKYLEYTTINNCKNLHYIALSESVDAVDTGAFHGCSRTKRFSLYPAISYDDLIYNDSFLDENCDFEICEESDIYRSESYPIHKTLFDGFGCISLPLLFINGVVATDLAKEFQADIGLNPYELKKLLQEEYCIVDKDLVTFDYYKKTISSTVAPLTGVHGIIELMHRKKIHDKYSNLIIDKIPVPTYAWRSKYVSNGNPVDTQLNQLYKSILSSIKSYNQFPNTSLSITYEKRIQSTLLDIAQNHTYQSAMWYLKKTRTME